MARRRNGGAEEEGANWMDTYGDMITLVLTFFVLLYSFSSIDQSKWQMIAQSFSSKGKFFNTVVDSEQTPPPEDGNNATDEPLKNGELPETFDQLYQYLVNYVNSNGLGDQVAVDKGATHVYLKFTDTIFFGGDSDVLLDDGKKLLDGMSTGIAAVDQYILKIRINGHTAEGKYSTVSDRLLSSGRANAVLMFLEDKKLCDPEKMSAVGYGKYQPIAPNDTEENRKKNRRVEIIILRNDVDYTSEEILKDYLNLDLGIVVDP